ncbi:helix-turn-helix domain-containing protein [Bacillus sp. FJAT-45350]|uniref:helix-turn-helix domain-containing protein n=1 Tax=Bacillus sp. FJAT-45350 TaxID=2011014 RepID=UPI000BB76E81|nr:helix-turn-helix transcriptional regulator [Bacillus sp. FJAT-45350]
MHINSDVFMEVAEDLLGDKYEEILQLWRSDDEDEAFRAFQLLINTIIDHEDEVSCASIVTLYGQQIVQIMSPLLETYLDSTEKGEMIEKLLSEEVAETGSSLLFHKLREAISLNSFSKKDGIPTVEIKNGNQTHVAQIHTHVDDGMILTNGEIDQWETLMAQAITSMDDLTADAFDVISILWMKSASTEKDMVSFNHEDVLTMRQIQKNKNKLGYGTFRKKDRDEVMKRIAALASIWLRVDEDDEVHFIDQTSLSEYKKSKLKRLFVVDNVTIAHDRQTNDVIGIYECEIRPGDLLASYLHGAKKSTGMLSLKALQYNPVKHKHHKRLTRYLSWQWRIRSRKTDFERPYNIGGERGLLSVLGMDSTNDKRPFRVKESFESILDTLQEDKIIDSWHYVSIDETRMGKGNRGWLTNYWMTLQVIILPPKEIISGLSIEEKPRPLEIEEVINEFGKKLSRTKKRDDQMNREEQLVLGLHFEETDSTSTDYKITPELVQHTRKKRGLTLSKAAKEIGIAHTTLSRFEKNEIKKPNSKNDEKLRKWITEEEPK